MDIFIMRTGILQKAEKRDRTQKPRSRRFTRWNPSLLDVKIGKGRVFFTVNDDAVMGISLNRTDLRKLLEEIEFKDFEKDEK